MVRRLFPLLFALAVLALALGCDGHVIITDPDTGFLPFQTVLQSQTSGIASSREEVIESYGEWVAVWNEIGRGGPPPQVDFGRDMVLLVAAGTEPNGCYSIEIRDVEARFGGLRVSADLNEPGTGCVCPQGIVRPVHAVRVERRSGGVDFNVRRVTLSCR